MLKLSQFLNVQTKPLSLLNDDFFWQISIYKVWHIDFVYFLRPKWTTAYTKI